jgi:restriction system protein
VVAHLPPSKSTWSPLYVEAENEFERHFIGRTHELQAIHQSLAKQSAAAIYGARGSGKTALLYKVRKEVQKKLLGGVALIHGQNLMHTPLVEEVNRQIDIPARGQALLIIDDADALTQNHISELNQFIAENRMVQLLLSAQSSATLPFTRGQVISLGGLSEQEYYQLLSQHIKSSSADTDIARRLWEATSGNPLFAHIAGRTIRDQLLTLRDILESFQGFRHAGILDTSGNPLVLPASISQQHVIAVENTNHKILELLRVDPKVFWSLPPRKFEEIVAELLAGMGYDVELTPPSKDGGFDMYAAKKDKVGRFLFLVECKRYVPPHKVGVQVIRSLYGVVQQKSANAGIVATTSFFTKGASEFEQERKYQIQLSDYFALQNWLKGRG